MFTSLNIILPPQISPIIKKSESILHPVLEDPIALLAQVCRDALECCHDLVGIDDLRFIAIRGSFERALAGFLAAYETYAKVGA